jgi:hypothetical protein
MKLIIISYSPGLRDLADQLVVVGEGKYNAGSARQASRLGAGPAINGEANAG